MFPLFLIVTTHQTREQDLIWNLDSHIEKNWPHFVIVEFLDEGRYLTKLSPSALSNAIHSLAGGAEDIKKHRSEQLLVEVDKPMQSAKTTKS